MNTDRRSNNRRYNDRRHYRSRSRHHLDDNILLSRLIIDILVEMIIFNIKIDILIDDHSIHPIIIIVIEMRLPFQCKKHLN